MPGCDVRNDKGDHACADCPKREDCEERAWGLKDLKAAAARLAELHIGENMDQLERDIAGRYGG